MNKSSGQFGPLVLALTALGGCEHESPALDATQYVMIDVVSDHGECRVQKNQLACADVVNYVGSILKTPPDQRILVGAFCFDRDGKQARELATSLTNAGHTNVGVLGFIGEAPSGRGC